MELKPSGVFASKQATKNQTHQLKVSFGLNVTRVDIDDIMCSALESGISYWCSAAEVVGKYLGEHAHEQISLGGTLMLHDSEENKKYELTLDKFLKGLKLFLENGRFDHVDIENERIDFGNFDSVCADSIVQFALFGETIFG